MKGLGILGCFLGGVFPSRSPQATPVPAQHSASTTTTTQKIESVTSQRGVVADNKEKSKDFILFQLVKSFRLQLDKDPSNPEHNLHYAINLLNAPKDTLSRLGIKSPADNEEESQKIYDQFKKVTPNNLLYLLCFLGFRLAKDEQEKIRLLRLSLAFNPDFKLAKTAESLLANQITKEDPLEGLQDQELREVLRSKKAFLSPVFLTLYPWHLDDPHFQNKQKIVDLSQFDGSADHLKLLVETHKKQALVSEVYLAASVVIAPSLQESIKNLAISSGIYFYFFMKEHVEQQVEVMNLAYPGSASMKIVGLNSNSLLLHMYLLEIDREKIADFFLKN